MSLIELLLASLVLWGLTEASLWLASASGTPRWMSSFVIVFGVVSVAGLGNSLGKKWLAGRSS